MNTSTRKSYERSHLPVIGYGIGVVVCLGIWVGIFAGARHILKETTIGETKVARLSNGLPEGRSSTLISTDCK